MINLIPPEQKQAITYARRNTRLVRVMTGILVAVVGAGIITGGGLFYLRRDTASAQASISQAQDSLKDQKEAETLEHAKNMSENLKLAVDVLSSEVLFSQLLHELGEIMPPGTVLENISLTNQVFGLGIDLEVGAQDYETGSRAYVNLNDTANGLFEKADLITISCSRDGAYPCYAKVRALFSKNNPFLLIGGSSS